MLENLSRDQRDSPGIALTEWSPAYGGTTSEIRQVSPSQSGVPPTAGRPVRFAGYHPPRVERRPRRDQRGSLLPNYHSFYNLPINIKKWISKAH